MLLRNEGSGNNLSIKFSHVATALNADDIKDGRGLGLADFDNDGDLDMIISNSPGDRQLNRSISPTLLRNDVGQKQRWLAVELTGTRSNRDAVGAVVRLQVKRHDKLTTLTRHISAGSSYASQHSYRLHFGLGKHTNIDSLEVRWPSGSKTCLHEVPTNQILHIQESL